MNSFKIGMWFIRTQNQLIKIKKILDSVPGLHNNACPTISIYEKMLILQFPTAS